MCWTSERRSIARQYMAWPRGSKEPITELGIKRMKCIRCGASARYQWQICADGNRYRAICTKCDIALNAMVLKWFGDPDAKTKIARYKARQ